MKISSGLLALTMTALVTIWWFNHSKEAPQPPPTQATTMASERSKSDTAATSTPEHATPAPTPAPVEVAPNQDHNENVAANATPNMTLAPTQPQTRNVAAENTPREHKKHAPKITYFFIYSLIFLLIGLSAVFMRYKSILRPAFAEPYNLFRSIQMAIATRSDDNFSVDDEPVPDHEILKKMRICLALIGVIVMGLVIVGWLNYSQQKAVTHLTHKKPAKKAIPYTPVVETSVPDSLLTDVDQEDIPTETMTQRTENTTTNLDNLGQTGQMTLLYPLDESKYTPLPKGTFDN